MRIIIYTPTFSPHIGGMEMVAQYLSDLLVQAGHECRLITPVKSLSEDCYSFNVYRSPDLFTKIRLILWADVVFSIGASMALLPLSKLLLKPFVWKHAGYQVSCIDGLGWVNGRPAPVEPWQSVRYHLKIHGLLFTFKHTLKLFIRRFAAKHMVTMNVAITDWMMAKQPFKRQVRIYNPSPLSRFKSPSPGIQIEYDFLYMGRLVSEKGISTLIKAFHLLVLQPSYKELKLLIVGDGSVRQELEEFVSTLQLNDRIIFMGKKTGQELTDSIHKARIAVVPSEWEEPMGIVALELMAADRNLIVSERGGLKECIGKTGFTFPNGDYHALAECMSKLLQDTKLAEQQRAKMPGQLKKFKPEKLAQEYINLFESILKKK